MRCRQLPGHDIEMFSLLAGRCCSSDVKPLQQDRREESVHPDGTGDQGDAPRAKVVEHTTLGCICSREYTDLP